MAREICSPISLLIKQFHHMTVSNCKGGLGNVFPGRRGKRGSGEELAISATGALE